LYPNGCKRSCDVWQSRGQGFETPQLHGERNAETLATAGVDLDQYMDDNSSAILVVVDNQYLDGFEAALGKADDQVSKAISKGDYDDIVDALSKGGDEVADAIDS
jgi:hypothetical protein